MAIEQEKEGQPRHVSQIRRDKEESKVSSASDGQSQCSHTASLDISHPTSLASLCPLSGGSNINIVCCWSAIVHNEGRDVAIQGQHHLRDLLVRPLNKSKGSPLALTAKYTPRVSHNFDERPLVSIFVVLLATSLSFQYLLLRPSDTSTSFLPNAGGGHRNHHSQSTHRDGGGF